MNTVGITGQAARLLDDQGKSLLGLAFVWYLEPTLALDRSEHGIARSATCIRAWRQAWEAVLDYHLLGDGALDRAAQEIIVTLMDSKGSLTPEVAERCLELLVPKRRALATWLERHGGDPTCYVVS
jgi:hypothetical protein